MTLAQYCIWSAKWKMVWECTWLGEGAFGEERGVWLRTACGEQRRFSHTKLCHSPVLCF